MATYDNDLRLKEIATGDESGTWGDSTNTNLELIADGFSYGTKEMAADANETFTMPDFSADATRSLYLKITSAVSLTTTRVVTLGPNTVSKTWIIENATTGSQIITIAQGSGATVNVPNGSKLMIVTDGAGGGAAVFNANPTIAAVNLATDVTGTLPVANGGTGTATPALVQGANITITGTWPNQTIATAAPGTGTVTSVGGTGTVNGITLTGTVTSSGNLTLGGTLANVSLTTQVTGTLPIANGGTGSTSTTYVNLTTNVTGTLPVANGGTGITSFGSGVATWLGTPSSANLAAAVTDETGSGALVFATSPTLVTPVLGTPTSGTLSGCTVDGTNAVGFRTIPQNSQSAAYTLVLADSGKHIFHPSADTTARTFTIPANSSVAYPIGTAITFINQDGAGVITIAITTDTMRLSPAGTTGSRTLAANGSATCIKVTSTEWLISGSGLT